MGRKAKIDKVVRYPKCTLPKWRIDNAFRSTRKAVIYSLAHPETKEIFYVGSTIMPFTRMSHHKKTFGFSPVFEVIEVCTRLGDHRGRVGLSDIEVFWIGQFSAWGFPLINKVGHTKFLGRKNKTKTSLDIISKIEVPQCKTQLIL